MAIEAPSRTVMTAIASQTADPARDRPADPRERRRELELQPARRLVRRAARDERRRGEPDEDEAQLGERELEEPGRGRDVDPRDEVPDGLGQAGEDAIASVTDRDEAAMTKP